MLHGRVERHHLMSLLDRPMALERIEELHPLVHRHAHLDALEPGLDGPWLQADAVARVDPVLGERVGQKRVAAQRKRPVDPILDPLAPQVARHPEELPSLRVSDDDDVRVRLEGGSVHHRDHGRH